MNQKSKSGISDRKSFHFFADILAGLRYLHKNDIYHGALKPSNVLLDKFNRVELCDYGWMSLSKKMVSKASKNDKIEFIAPEVLQFEAFTASADIYSAGMLLYYMAMGKTPPSSATVKKRKFEFEFPNNKFSKDLVLLIKSMTHPIHSKRPNIPEIIRSPWVKRMEFETGMNLSFILQIKRKKNSSVLKPTYEEFRKISARMGKRSDSKNSLSSHSRDGSLLKYCTPERRNKMPTLSNFCKESQGGITRKYQKALNTLETPRNANNGNKGTFADLRNTIIRP